MEDINFTLECFSFYSSAQLQMLLVLFVLNGKAKYHDTLSIITHLVDHLPKSTPREDRKGGGDDATQDAITTFNSDTRSGG